MPIRLLGPSTPTIIYITGMLLANIHCPTQNLCSSNRSLLELLSHPRTVFYGKRSFAHVVPKC